MTKRDADYFSQKYSLTRTHSEVLHAATIVPPGRALDLGCGNGRNSLYLAANGFAVTAWDKNPMSLNNLESIRAAERLDNLQTAVKDLNSLSFDGEYDLILSTVVMMFLEPDTIPGLIANMQRCTATGHRTMDTDLYFEAEVIDASTNKPVIKVVRKGEGKTLANENTPLTVDTLKQVIDDMAVDAVKFDPSQR